MFKRFIIALMISTFMATPAMSVETLTFSTADSQDLPRSKSMNAVVTECFKRLGYDIIIQPVPSKRSLHDANNGVVDGNFVRTSGISDIYRNLVKIPEPISKNIIVAFSKELDFTVDGWESLLPFNVAWVRGWRNCERNLSTAKSVNQVNTERSLFTFLSAGRADIGVFGLETGNQTLWKLGITDVHALSPPIVESDLFLFIHKKHADLVPKAAAMLRRMKKEGLFQAILDRYYMDQPQFNGIAQPAQ